MSLGNVVFNDHVVFILQVFHDSSIHFHLHHGGGRNRRRRWQESEITIQNQSATHGFCYQAPTDWVQEASDCSLRMLVTQSRAVVSQEGGRHTTRAIRTWQLILGPYGGCTDSGSCSWMAHLLSRTAMSLFSLLLGFDYSPWRRCLLCSTYCPLLRNF